MDTCNICGGNAVILKCKTCLIKCCKGCFQRHIDSCSILKKDKHHQCQHHDELVKAYCCNCVQLICKDCVIDNHIRHDSISLLEAYHNRGDILKEFIWKQPVVIRYIDDCNEALKKYCILQVQIKEGETDFQRYIGSVRESLLQQVAPNIKLIEDHCKAGEEVLQLQTIPPEDARKSQMFPLIYLAQLSRYRNELNAFEKQFMDRNMLADLKITQSKEDVHQAFLTKLVETASTCDKANTTGVHAPTIPDMADQSFAEDPQQQTTHNDSDGDEIKKLVELSTELGEHKRERAYILEFLKSFPETVEQIESMTEVSSTDIVVNVPREENIVAVRFSEEMRHVFNSMMKIKNHLIKTEQDLKNKISSIAKWTNDQRQSEKEEIRIRQGIADEKNKQLEILKKDQAIKDEKIKQLETLNKDLHQRLQGKRNLKKLETECNQLKEEQAKLQNQRQQGAQQYQKLCKKNKDLQEGLKTARKIINESQKKVTDLENEVHGLKVTTEKQEHDIKALRAEKDDCLNRLSSMAGDKLTKGNPAITDLGDPNRPMKIAEKYGGLYDNEWTDAMESSNDAMRTLFPAVDHQQFDEILVYHLHRLVMCCYRECLKLSTEQEQTIRSAIINSMKLQIDEDGTDVNNMPGYREIVNLRRQNAQQFANTLFQNKMISMTTITTDWDYIYKKEELIGQLLETPFFEKCVHLCWYMVIQDPVMYMTEEIKPDTVYDRDVYKEFMQSGDKVKYVVWPALFLHEGGPLLYKGVVEAYK